MTPTELLEEAKDRFIVLYHNDDTKLQRLLRQALGKYQDKAGSLSSVKVTEDDGGEIDIPADFLDFATVMDANTKWVEHYIEGGKIKIEAIDIEDTALGDTVYPVTVHYFQNLRQWALDTDLPTGSTGILLDYLVALINIPNTERERAVNASTNVAVDLPTKQELEEKVRQIEDVMEESRSVGFPVAVW